MNKKDWSEIVLLISLIWLVGCLCYVLSKDSEEDMVPNRRPSESNSAYV